MFWFNKAKEALLGGLIDADTDTLKAALIDETADTPAITDEFLSAVSAGVIGTAQTLIGVTITNGVLTCDDITFPSFTGNAAQGFIVYQDTGNAATSRLLLYQDGEFTVTAAAAAVATDTTIRVDPLEFALADNFQLVFSGGTTAQLSAAEAAGQRILSVDSLPDAIAEGETATGRVSGCGFPTAAFSSSGLQVTFAGALANL